MKNLQSLGLVIRIHAERVNIGFKKDPSAVILSCEYFLTFRMRWDAFNEGKTAVRNTAFILERKRKWVCTRSIFLSMNQNQGFVGWQVSAFVRRPSVE